MPATLIDTGAVLLFLPSSFLLSFSMKYIYTLMRIIKKEKSKMLRRGRCLESIKTEKSEIQSPSDTAGCSQELSHIFYSKRVIDRDYTGG